MSVSFGFYNSKNGDRRYDAIQMSSIFDGLIRDGIFRRVRKCNDRQSNKQEEMIVHVGIGRAWFNHTWTLNDSILPLSVSMSEVILDRIDMVVIDIDSRDDLGRIQLKLLKVQQTQIHPGRILLRKRALAISLGLYLC